VARRARAATRARGRRRGLIRPMLELPGVTLACVDTANPALALRALAKSAGGVRFARVVLFTTPGAPVAAPPGIEVVPIAPIASREAYSQFLLKQLVAHVLTDHVLIAQWDGYVVNPAAWDPAFLACDYLGAKWYWYEDGMRVGNGGFSLRSRRLLEALQDPRIQLDEAEDLTIGRTYRPLLEREHGIRFGSEALADRFSFEAAHPIGRPFGFHGLFNFCRVMPPAELAGLVPQFTDVIARSPQCAQLLRNCIALGQWAPAIAIARRILATGDDAQARALLAHAEAAVAAGAGIGRNDPCPCGSGRRYKQCHGAVGAAPDLAAAGAPRSLDDLAAEGVALHQRGDAAGAKERYEAVLARDPGHALALHFLGVVHYQRDDPAAALPLLERSVELRPEEPEFHNNLGLALARTGRDDEAVAAYERALARHPAHAGALNNMGLSLRAQNRVSEAIAAYRRAIALQPAFGEAHWNLALALLANGEFAEGWREYETRLALGVFQQGISPAPGPRWDGRDPRGMTLLLTAEQGLGDAIQFVRLADALASRGARVVVRAPAPLVTLFRSVPGVDHVVGSADPLPRYDAQVPILSLPGLLGVDGDRIPARVPYLTADPALRERVRPALAAQGSGLRIGVAWQGSRANADDRRRSTTLSALAPLLAVPGVRWYSLQKDDDADDPHAAPLVRLDDRRTLEGTAALVAELDLVVSVDTSIAHLAGALARPVWLLLAFAADWRWGIAGDRTPWYPSMRIFRQPAPGDWTTVARAAAEALATLAAVRA